MWLEPLGSQPTLDLPLHLPLQLNSLGLIQGESKYSCRTPLNIKPNAVFQVFGEVHVLISAPQAQVEERVVVVGLYLGR